MGAPQKYCCNFTENLTYSSEQIPGCEQWQHKCDGNKCIPKQYVCNEVVDCSDLTDEQGCKCDHNEFTCRNQECIPTQYKCNGLAECADSSDEDDETCKGNVAL